MCSPVMWWRPVPTNDQKGAGEGLGGLHRLLLKCTGAFQAVSLCTPITVSSPTQPGRPPCPEKDRHWDDVKRDRTDDIGSKETHRFFSRSRSEPRTQYSDRTYSHPPTGVTPMNLSCSGWRCTVGKQVRRCWISGTFSAVRDCCGPNRDLQWRAWVLDSLPPRCLMMAWVSNPCYILFCVF